MQSFDALAQLVGRWPEKGPQSQGHRLADIDQNILKQGWCRLVELAKKLLKRGDTDLLNSI